MAYKLITIFFAIILLSGTIAVVIPETVPSAMAEHKENSNDKSNPNALGWDHTDAVKNFPNNTPLQESIKKAIKIMKEGDPEKPKENNGKRPADEIPDVQFDFVGVEEIKKDGKLVGKKIETKTTLTFKNPKQMLDKNGRDWSKYVVHLEDVPNGTVKDLKKICEEGQGKFQGNKCDLTDRVIEKLNKQLLDDLDGEPLRFPINQNDSEFEITIKEELSESDTSPDRKLNPPGMEKAKKHPALYDPSNFKVIKAKDGNFFKEKGNLNGIEIANTYRQWEITEKVTYEFDTDEEYAFVAPVDFKDDLTNVLSPLSEIDLDFSKLAIQEADAIADDIQTTTVSKTMMMGVSKIVGEGYFAHWYDRSCFDWWHLHFIWHEHHTTWWFFGWHTTPYWELHIDAHLHTTCITWYDVRFEAGVEAGVGFRLPVEITLAVPRILYPNKEFEIDAAITPLDFTAAEYRQFCYDNPGILGTGVANCDLFAASNFIDPGDGDEFFVRAGAFVRFSGSVIGIAFPSININPTLSVESICTIYKIKNDIPLDPNEPGYANFWKGVAVDQMKQYIQRVLEGTADANITKIVNDFLKNNGLNCGSYTTPFGYDAGQIAAFGQSFDEGGLDSFDWGQFGEQYATGKVSPLTVNQYGSPLTFPFLNHAISIDDDCTKWAPAVICFPSLKTGVFNVIPELSLTTSASSNQINTDYSLTNVQSGGSGKLKFQAKNVIVGLPFYPVVDGPNVAPTVIKAKVKDTGNGSIDVNLQNLVYYLNHLNLALDFALNFGGSANTILQLSPISFNILNLNLGLGEFGIPVNQHPGTNPFGVSIPVDWNLRITAPSDIVTETAAGETSAVVDLGSPAADQNYVTVSNDAPDGNIFPAGKTIVTWMATSKSDSSIFATDTQTVIVRQGLLVQPGPDSITRLSTYVPGQGDGLFFSETFNPRVPPTVHSTAGQSYVLPAGTECPDGYYFEPFFNSCAMPAIDANCTNCGTLTDNYKVTFYLHNGIPYSNFNPGPHQFPDVYDVTANMWNAELGINKVTWTATDIRGNQVSDIQNFIVIDDVPPKDITNDSANPIVWNIDETLEATSTTQTIVTNAPILSDDYSFTVTPPIQTTTGQDGIIQTNTSEFSGLTLGENIVAWTAIDSSGNIANFHKTITIQDTTPPEIIAPADIIQEAIESEQKVAIGDAQTSDLFPVTVSNDAPSLYKIGTTVVTWTATDSNGNVSTDTQNIIIQDTTPPTIVFALDDSTTFEDIRDGTKEFTTEPPVLFVEATGEVPDSDSLPIGLLGVLDVSTTELVSGKPPLTKPGEYVFTYTATDEYGNTSTVEQRVVLADTTPPVVTDPPDVIKEATDSITKLDIGKATAKDIYPITKILNDAPKSTSIESSQWTATGDSAVVIDENLADDGWAIFEYDLTRDDFEPRTWRFTSTATKSNNITLDIKWIGFHSFENTLAYLATINPDGSQTILRDEPYDGQIEYIDTVTFDVESGQTYGFEIRGNNHDQNNVLSGLFTINVKDLNTFPLGTTEVHWTAIDANGNSATTSTQLVTIVDTTPPQVTDPADITTEATAVLTPVDIGQATATDIFDIVSITNDAPAEFPLGTTEVHWTAIDANGNSATTSTQLVTIVDTTQPVLTVPADIITDATGITTPITLGIPTATDIFQIESIVSDAPAEFPLGVTLVHWTATDENGNYVTKIQHVTINSPKVIKNQIIDDLKSLINDATQENTKKELEKAIKDIQNSLEQEFWIDEIHLDPNSGDKSIKEESDSVQRLMIILRTNENDNKQESSEFLELIQLQIDRIVNTDRILAQVAIDQAETSDHTLKSDNEITKAKEEMQKAIRDLDNNMFNQAVDHYQKAWMHAQNALRHGLPDNTLQELEIDPEPDTIVFMTIPVSADSFLRMDSKNSNEGANEILHLQSPDTNHVLITFAQNDMDNTVNNLQLESATLRLYVKWSDNMWGDGKNIATHVILQPWIEGNGALSQLDNIDGRKGDGKGVTWNCAVDQNLKDDKSNCNSVERWDGGNIASSSNSVIITSLMRDQWIEFDVTSDVQNFLNTPTHNNGWLIKKQNENESGQVFFNSKESGNNAPELVLVLR